jgi:hypothetical protein
MTERNLSTRDALVDIIRTRIVHSMGSGPPPDNLANLIADDILGSSLRTERDSIMITRGQEAGFEKGLREAIGAVGDMDRQAGWEGGPYNLIQYDEAQKAIARLSKRGMEDLWTGNQHDPDQGGIVPPWLLEKVREQE